MPPQILADGHSILATSTVDGPCVQPTVVSSNRHEQSPLVRETDINMLNENERLKTFANWRVSFLSPESMVKAGFYYLKRADLVRCAFCGVEVARWEESDEPLADHRKWSPRCHFLADPIAAGNISSSSEGSSEQSSSSSSYSSPPPSETAGYDVCGAMERSSYSGNTPPNPSSETIGVQKTRPPVFPEYSLLEKRLDSFSTWPVSLRVRPRPLAEAGFFYTGKGDQTICFYCGGGLKDWEEEDDPWVEHAKWFTKCYYVLISKGDPFISNALKNLDPECKSKGKSEDSSSNSKASTAAETSLQLEKPTVSGEKSRDQETNEKLLCKICYMKDMCVLFLPCSHLMACVDCAMNMDTCGVCRKPIKSQLRTYIS